MASVDTAIEFRKVLDNLIGLYLELVPPEILAGYQMKDCYYSSKQSLKIRRIKISGTSYTIHPSFVMPYMSGLVDEVENALFLRKFNVPFWALSHFYGKNPMYWYRIEKSLGRNSIVGTTIWEPGKIPKHLGADEKNPRILGNKTYVATIVGDECILGASISKDAGEKALHEGMVYQSQYSRCYCSPNRKTT
jgi:hypothetical protein